MAPDGGAPSGVPLVLTGLAFALSTALTTVRQEVSSSGFTPLLVGLVLGLTALFAASRIGPTPGGRTLSLIAFPTVVIIGIALTGAPTPSSAAALVVMVTWCVYVAVALAWGAAPSAPGTKTQPIADRPTPTPRRVAWVRRAYFAAMGGGGIMLAVITPTMGSDSAYREAFGEAAPSARVLVAVVGGALTLGMILGIMAPGLRRRSANALPSVRTTLLRAGVYVVLAIGLAVALVALGAA